jgi:hypothetical protein
MKPTLAVLHRVDDSERICFVCDHGMTAADHIGGNGATLGAAQRQVLARHAETCRCVPERFEDLWDSMAHMRAVTEADLAGETSVTVDPRLLVIARAQLDSMTRHACDECDPHVGVSSERGRIEFVVYHHDGCKRKTVVDRRFRVLDLSTGVSQ